MGQLPGAAGRAGRHFIAQPCLARRPGPPATAARILCQADDMRKYVIMGIQGSGKGTQAKMLAAEIGRASCRERVFGYV